MFDRSLVQITRKRFSVTQGSASVSYDGKYINTFHDEIRLSDDGWHGQDDDFWVEVARKWHEQKRTEAAEGALAALRRMAWLTDELAGGNEFSKDDLNRWAAEARSASRTLEMTA